MTNKLFLMLYNSFFGWKTPKEGLSTALKLGEPFTRYKLQSYFWGVLQLCLSGGHYQKKVFISPFEITPALYGDLPGSKNLLTTEL